MEAITQAEEIKKRVPWFVRYTESRRTLTHLLIVAILLMVGDSYEILSKEVPEIPPPPVLIVKAPLAPVIQSAHGTSFLEPKNSLRRRILRVCDELDAFIRKRAELRKLVPDTRDANGKAPELLKFEAETTALYVSSGLKNRTVEVIRDIKQKGFDTGFLEMWAQTAPLYGGTFPSFDTTMPLREYAYHLDATGNMVHIEP